MNNNYMPTFQYVKPTDEQIALMQKFRDEYAKLFEEVRTCLEVPSRGLLLALEHLEESAMWLNKAITEND